MDSYNSFPQAPSENVLLGTPEGRHHSPIRRSFCLLVAFDFFFTTLVWALFVILLKGEKNIFKAFGSEIFSYSLDSSLFDMVMCAACRIIILITCYAFLNQNHWLPVAITTGGSCAFSVAKVIYFGWHEYGDGTAYPVVIICSTFILSWLEAWFWDFRVVPKEKEAEIYYARQRSRAFNREDFWLGTPRVMSVAGNRGDGSTSKYYTPLDSTSLSTPSSESESLRMGRRKKRRKPRSIRSAESAVWSQEGPIIATSLVQKVKSLGWVPEKSFPNGDKICSKNLPRKIFMISGTILASAREVVIELFHNLEIMPNWNPSVTYCEILQILNERTDVSYQVSQDGPGGLIAARDFVTLRHYTAMPDGTEVIACVSVKHQDKPVQPHLVRGTNGISGWVFYPSTEMPNSGYTDFQWVLDAELKLSQFIPTPLVDSAVLSAAIATLSALRLRISGRLNSFENEVPSEHLPSTPNFLS